MQNSSEKSSRIVGIRFSSVGKCYYFDASSIEKAEQGDFVVVETSRGWQMGQLMHVLGKDEIKKNMHYKPVNRIATDDDKKKKKYLDEKTKDILISSREIIRSRKIKGVKIVTAEISFDEKNLTFLFTTENEKQINFNSVINDLKKKFSYKKINFHKIGPRDVAKYYGGMGACGLEVRCCTQFINKFESISIRMAKAQGISLTPSDITGVCDRLRCCLGYEYCTYVDAIKGMPKRNKTVKTPVGIGKVRDIAPLRKAVFVYIEGHGTKEFGMDEIEIIQPQQTKNETAPQNTLKNPRRNVKQKNRNRKNRGSKNSNRRKTNRNE